MDGGGAPPRKEVRWVLVLVHWTCIRRKEKRREVGRRGREGKERGRCCVHREGETGTRGVSWGAGELVVGICEVMGIGMRGFRLVL